MKYLRKTNKKIRKYRKTIRKSRKFNGGIKTKIIGLAALLSSTSALQPNMHHPSKLGPKSFFTNPALNTLSGFDGPPPPSNFIPLKIIEKSPRKNTPKSKNSNIEVVNPDGETTLEGAVRNGYGFNLQDGLINALNSDEKLSKEDRKAADDYYKNPKLKTPKKRSSKNSPK